MTGWRRTTFRRAVVLCTVVMLHGAAMVFFANSVQTVVLSKKENALQMVFITAQVLAPTEPAQVLPEVKAPAVPERLPSEIARTLPKVESLTAPEHLLPAEDAQGLPEPTLREVPSQREELATESIESSTLPSDTSRFRLHYHLAAKDGLVVKHGESTLTFDGDAARYVADFAWMLGDEKGLVRSEGKVPTILSPSVYMDTNQLPRNMSGLVQDSVSIIWMLRQKLQQRLEKSAQENSPSNGNFSMLLDNEEISYRWEILQTDELLLPGGAFNGVLLKSDSAVPGTPIFSIWFMPTRPYMPVRIMRTDSTGKVTDHLLKENLSELVKAT